MTSPGPLSSMSGPLCHDIVWRIFLVKAPTPICARTATTPIHAGRRPSPRGRAAKTPLAFFRKKRGMSQDDLAKRTGITQGYLSEIEIGRKSGDVRTLRKLADALKVSLDSLVPEEPSEQDTPRPAQRKSKRAGP